MIEGVISHVVFTVKNSRYDWQRIKRKKPVGFIAPSLKLIFIIFGQKVFIKK
jgi:hypothetical protein